MQPLSVSLGPLFNNRQISYEQLPSNIHKNLKTFKHSKTSSRRSYSVYLQSTVPAIQTELCEIRTMHQSLVTRPSFHAVLTRFRQRFVGRPALRAKEIVIFQSVWISKPLPSSKYSDLPPNYLPTRFHLTGFQFGSSTPKYLLVLLVSY